MAYLPTNQPPRILIYSGTVSCSCGALTTPISGRVLAATLSGSCIQLQPPSGSPITLVGLTFTIAGEYLTDTNHTYVTQMAISAGPYGFSDSIGSPFLLPVGTNTGSWTVTLVAQQYHNYTSSNGRLGTSQFIDIPVPGQAISGSFTFGGQTVSFTGVIPVSPGYAITTSGHIVQGTVQIDPVQLISGSMSLSMSTSFMGQSISLPFSHTYTTGLAGSVVLDLTSGLSLSAPGISGYSGGFNASINREVTKQVFTDGVIEAFDIAYPTSLVTEWTSFNTTPPTYTTFHIGDTISLDNYSGTISRWNSVTGFLSPMPVGSPQPPTLAMGDAISLRIQPQSLALAGEKSLTSSPSDPNIWNGQLRARMKWFNYLQIWQASSVIVDPCTSATGWTSNVTVSGGHLLVNTTSTGTAQRTFSSAFASEGYRYLEVDIKPASTSGGIVTLGVQNSQTHETWKYQETLGSSGVLTTIRFDLMAPFTGVGPAFLPDYYKS